MSNQSDKFSFKKWLEQSMHEGWQLELIISSILLVVLSGTDGVFEEWSIHLEGPSNDVGLTPGILLMIIILLEVAVSVAKLNLVIHIFLRGLWIGCIGLRNISDEIDFATLNYAPKFNKYLEKNVIDFDTYLERLEKNCSTIFSFTFLIIFEVFSMFMFIICLVSIIGMTSFAFELIFEDSASIPKVFKYVTRSIIIILFFSAFLHLIDFVFIGFFKRKKILAKIYYPFYRLYNFFSFSFLYRSVYYNFIDNKYGRTYVKMIIPYLIVISLIGGGVNVGEFKYLPDPIEGSNWLQTEYYDDTRNQIEGEGLDLSVSIPSMHLKESFLPVFLRHADGTRIDRVLTEICPDFKVYERSEVRLREFEAFTVGLNSEIKNAGLNEENDAYKIKADSALACVSQLFEVQIDSVKYDTLDYFFHKHPDLEWSGIITYLDVENFSRGMHTLQVTKITNYQDSIFVKRTFEIPFIKY